MKAQRHFSKSNRIGKLMECFRCAIIISSILLLAPFSYAVVVDDFNDGDLVGWKVIDDGNEFGPSQWSVVSGEVFQGSNILGADYYNDAARPGTNLIYTGGGSWSDYEFQVDLHMDDDDGVGVLFRYQDNENYYRFSMDSSSSYRRLVKKQAGEFTVLWEDAVPYITTDNHQITITLLGDSITVTLNGTTLTTVNDSSIQSGTVGLYCSAQADVNFDNIELIPTGSDQPPSIAITQPQTINHEAGASIEFNAIAVDMEDGDLSSAAQWESNIDGVLGTGDLTIASLQTGVHTITATLTDSSGNSVSASTNIVVATSAPEFSDNFDDLDFAGWNIVDNGNEDGPSVWSAATGMLVQSSNIYGDDFELGGVTKPGTHALYANGPSWQNYRATIDIRSQDDDDGIGVLFRYQDNDNYYRFSMNTSFNFRRLTKKENGIYTDLWEEHLPYVTNQTYQLAVTAFDNFLAVELDGEILVALNDSAIANGSIALYSWANGGATFDNVSVDELIVTTPSNTAPTITSISDRTIEENSSTLPIDFFVNDAETPAASLTVSSASSNPSLVPTDRILFGGGGTDRQVDIFPLPDQTGATVITLTVSDGSQTASESFVLTVTGQGSGNTAPTITAISDQTIAENTSTSAIAFTINDAETAASALTLSGASSNITLIPNANIVFGGSDGSRTVTVTPAANQTGSATVTVTVSDGTDTSSSIFLVTVNGPINTAPTITSISDQTIDENTSTAAIGFTIGDAETAAGALTLSTASSDTTLVPTTNIVLGGSDANRTVTVTPAASQTGSATITLTVSDGIDIASSSFLLSVSAVGNTAPTITAIGDQTIDENTSTGPIDYFVGDAQTAASALTVTGDSSNLDLVPVNRILFGGGGTERQVDIFPLPDQTGTTVITLTVSDGALTTSESFTLTVNGQAPANTAPILSLIAPADNTTVIESTNLTFSATASDSEDGDLSAAIQWSSNLDGVLGSGATINTNALSVGAHQIQADVTDSGGLSDTALLNITVNANTSPTLTLIAPANNAAFNLGDTITFQATASDAEDGDLGPTIRWASDLEGELGFGANFPYNTLGVGNHLITASVSDSHNAPVQASVVIDIVDPTDSVTQVDYRYNALGQRTAKIEDGQTTYFVYGLNGQLLAELDGSGNTQRDYLYNGNQVVALADANPGPNQELLYVHGDQLGTPRVVTDQTQAVVWRAEYSPFGVADIDEDPDGDGVEVGFNFRFPGQYYDKETDTNYNYYRTYDPRLGRYIQSDPIGLDGGINTYGYVYQNPLMYTDPNGLAGNFLLGVGVRFVLGQAATQTIRQGAKNAFGATAGGWIACALVFSCSDSVGDGGLADEPAPYDHYEEQEAVDFMPDPFGGDDACARLQHAIRVLRAQIAWRLTDLNPASGSYQGHLTRIAILQAALNRLEEAYRNICGGECPA